MNLILISFFIVLLIIIVLQCYQTEQYTSNTSLPRTLIIIISAPSMIPRWAEEKKVWEKYMHYGKKYNIDCVFTECEESFCYKPKCQDSYSPGILQKTLYTLEHYDNYDYYVRTNLSTFYIFPYLVNFIQNNFSNQNHQPMYGGFPFSWGVSGTGIVMNKKARTSLLNVGFNKEFFHNKKKYDDEIIGSILNKNGAVKISSNVLYFWDLGKPSSKNIKEIKKQKCFSVRLRYDKERKEYHEITKSLLQNFYGI